MRRLELVPVLASSVALLAACGASEPVASTRIEGNLLRVDLGRFEVPAGDTLTCFSTGLVTDREYAIGSALGMQDAGGHHITIYWTEDPTEFAPRPCRDEDMLTWNFVAGTGGEPGAGDDQDLPEGLAFRLPAHAHLVVQAHYINTTGAPLRVRDTLDIELLDPSAIDAYAAMFAISDGAFEIPPRTRFRRVSDCTVTQPLDVVLLLGHLHEAGTFFSLERLHDGAEPEMLYEQSWESRYVAHPPVRRWPTDEPLQLAAGTRLRQTCEWMNTESESLLFPSEMCVSSMYYYPDLGEGLIVCDPEVVTSSAF